MLLLAVVVLVGVDTCDRCECCVVLRARGRRTWSCATTPVEGLSTMDEVIAAMRRARV